MADPIPTPPRRVRRGGFVLVLVLGFAAIVTLATTAFLTQRATRMPQAFNRAGAAQANNVAASGIALAMHYLAAPPTTVAAGNYWTGVNGLNITGTADYCDIAVSRYGADARQFTISSTGVTLNPDGSILGKRTITAQVLTPPPRTWRFGRAIQMVNGVLLGSLVTINGDIHSNGNIDGTGNCAGNLTAGGTINWTSGVTPASKSGGVSALTFPARADFTKWTRYTVHGVSYQAKEYTLSALSALNVALTSGSSSVQFEYPGSGGITVLDLLSALLGGLLGLGDTVGVITDSGEFVGAPISAHSFLAGTNPGGVIYKNGNLSVSGGITVLGTLVVNGNLNLGLLSSLTIYAMPNYPALIVRGNIDVAATSSLRVYGVVQCDGSLSGGSPANFEVTGAYTSSTGQILSGFADSKPAVFTWSENHSRRYDFSPNTGEPMTILRWNE